jgi:hypothetical protein
VGCYYRRKNEEGEEGGKRRGQEGMEVVEGGKGAVKGIVEERVVWDEGVGSMDC